MVETYFRLAVPAERDGAAGRDGAAERDGAVSRALAAWLAVLPVMMRPTRNWLFVCPASATDGQSTRSSARHRSMVSLAARPPCPFSTRPVSRLGTIGVPRDVGGAFDETSSKRQAMANIGLTDRRRARTLTIS